MSCALGLPLLEATLDLTSAGPLLSVDGVESQGLLMTG